MCAMVSQVEKDLSFKNVLGPLQQPVEIGYPWEV